MYTYLNHRLISLSFKHLASQDTKNLEEYSALVVGIGDCFVLFMR